MSSRARRPYLMGDASVVQFYQNPARYLKEMVAKESTFEKPYLDEEYRKMHFDFPVPDWPPFPDFPPFPDIPGPTPGLSWCAITCYTPLDCDEPIWCHPSIWCGTDLECNLCSWVVEGATSGYSPHAMSLHWNWGIDVWIDSELVEAGGEALISVCMTDPCGNVCCEDAEVTCKVCPPEVVMSWASAADLTIARNTSVEVRVADGLGPYTWSVTGTGFSMLHPTTAGVINEVVADNTACGLATVTVTDYCRDTTVGYLRCTEGQWVEDCESLDPDSNCNGPSISDVVYHHYHYVGDKRIHIHQRCTWSSGQACTFLSCGGFNSEDYKPTQSCTYYSNQSCLDNWGVPWVCDEGLTGSCCTLNLGITVEHWTC